MTAQPSSAGANVRIAVLIDCDNVSPTHTGAVLEELASFGTPTIKRAYGDWTTTQLSGWKKELNRRAIQPVQQFAYTAGKNSTDSALIIDAMDLLWMDNVEAFAIVSSDSDFTRLATRLRESGKKVIGLGRRRTPISLRNAVDQFIYLELLGGDEDEASDGDAADTGQGAERSAPVSDVGAPARGDRARTEGADLGDEPAAPAVQTDVVFSDAGVVEQASRINLQSALTKALNATSGDDGWTTLSVMGQHLNRTHADFDPRDFGHRKLSDLVAEQPYLDHVTDGGQMHVRLKKRSGGRRG